MLRFFRKSLPLKRRFVGDERGVTIVEFGLLAPIFFPLILSILEISLLYTKIALIDNSMAQISKQIYVGAASSGTVTYEELEQQICDDMIFAPSDCTSNLLLELTEISSLTDLPDTAAQCEYTNIPIEPTVNFDPGGSSTTVFMRACYVTDIFTPGIGFGLQLPKTNGNQYAIISSTAFVNEPF